MKISKEFRAHPPMPGARAVLFIDNTGLTVIREEMRIVGVPVGTEQSKRDFFQEAVNREPDTFVRALVWMEISQRAFIFCVYLLLDICYVCLAQSPLPSHATLLQITTLW